MSYLVLARKYRPQTFEQVVRQEHVTRTLTNAISADRVAHAVLFAGPRGTGKTTVARILAKAMNCLEGAGPEPCNQCRSCREITNGSAADVFEIDGASNNGVEQVRELRDNVQYMPSHSRFKIYIIDEVHMLSIAAFNALLKTLEEPPAHVMFLFATTEPRKIPITILSRCQRHDLRRIDRVSLVNHMQEICKRESVDIPDKSLALIAGQAGGSMRDALSLLDQIIASTGGDFSHDLLLDLLGVVDRKILADITTALVRADVPVLLALVDEIHQRGVDIRKFYTDLLEHFRNLMVVKLGGRSDQLIDLPADEIKTMRRQVEDVSSSFLDQLFSLLFKEEASVRMAHQPRLAMEQVFFKMARIPPTLSIETLIEKLDQLGKAVYDPPGDAAPEDADIGRETGGGKLANASVAGSGPTSLPAAKTADETAEIGADLDQHKDTLWQKARDIIGQQYPALASNLAQSVVERIADGQVEIAVNGNDFNLKLLKREKNKAVIGKICSRVFQSPVNVILKNGRQQQRPPQKSAQEAKHVKKEALDHPLVSDAIEIFDGHVVDVKIIGEENQ